MSHGGTEDGGPCSVETSRKGESHRRDRQDHRQSDRERTNIETQKLRAEAERNRQTPGAEADKIITAHNT